MRHVMRYLLAPAFAALLACTGAWAQVREHSFKLAFAVSGDNAMSRGAAAFKNEVERLSDGRMKVVLFPGSQLGPDLQVLSALRAGAVEAQISTTSLLGGIDNGFNLYDIPFLFRDFREVYAVADGEPGRRLQAIAEKNGFVILSTHSGGWRNLTNRVRAVASVADMRGMKLRTLQNSVFIDFWKALGAQPVAIPFPELFSALDQGTVDGQENVNGVTVHVRLVEVQKYFTETRHAAYVGALLFSGPVWQRLNEDERRVLRTASENVTPQWRKGLIDEDERLLQIIRQKLRESTLSPAARAEMEKLAQPVIEQHLRSFDPALVEQARAAIASVRK